MLARRLLPWLAAALTAAALASCEAVDQAQQTAQDIDRAAQCVRLVGDLTGISLDQASAEQAQRQAEELRGRLDTVSDTEVRQAAENLAGKLQQLADARASLDQAAIERAVREATAAAQQLANVCGTSIGDLTGG